MGNFGARSRYLEGLSYSETCLNETWIDQQSLYRAGLLSQVPVFPARVTKLLPILKGAKSLLLAGRIANFVWPFAAPVFFVWRAFMWWAAGWSAGKMPSRQCDRVWLFFSSGVGAIPLEVREYLKPNFVIYGPNHVRSQMFREHEGARVHAGTKAADYYQAWKSSVWATWCIIKTQGIARSTQTYTAFDWFMAAKALPRLVNACNPSEMVFVNHYDRWAILFDSWEGGIRRILVQHGALPLSPIPVRMKNVDIAYAYSNQQADLFRSNVLAPVAHTEIRVCKPALPYSEGSRPQGGRKRILVIGDPTQAFRDAEIVEEILQLGVNAEMLVKPHPSFSPAPYLHLEKLGAKLLDRDTYPRVDVCICAVSTLGLQYEAHDIPVIWHADMTLNEVMIELGEILNSIDNLEIDPGGSGIEPTALLDR